METWEQIEPGFWVSNFGNMSLEPPPGWTPPAPVAIGTPYTAPAAKPWWETAEAYQGDADGIGSMRSATNPNTGKAESLVSVRKPNENGEFGVPELVPYSVYQQRKASDPSLRMDTLKAPGTDMIDQGTLADLKDAFAATAPVAAGMILPGLISPWIGSALGTSPLISNALASAGSSLLTGGDPLQGALSSLAMGGLDQLSGGATLPAGEDFSGAEWNFSAPTTAVAGGTYGGNTTMTDVAPQVNYGLPDTGMLGNGLKLHAIRNSDILGMGGANPESNMGFNLSGTIPGATSTIGEGFNASGFAPFFGGDYGNAVNVIASPAGIAQKIGLPSPIPDAPIPDAPIPEVPAPDISPWLLAGGSAAGLGALTGSGGSGTITSGGDVDLTGVGTDPNPYNVDPNASGDVPDWMKAMGIKTWADLAKMGANALPGLLGAYASNQQTNALTSLADRYAEYGAPSRARYEASMTRGFDPTSIAGYQGALDTASNTLLRRLSAQNGNPYGNPGGLIEANKQIVAGTALPAVQEYQRMNAGTGGLASLAAAYPQTQNAATGSNANMYNSIGYGIDRAINGAPTTLADIYKLINTGTQVA